MLDRSLEDGRLDIEAISGTSAGAMNAVVLAEGYLESGREGARKSLAKFWRSISDEGAFTPAQQKFVHLFFQDWPLAGQSRLLVDGFPDPLFEPL